MLHSRLRRAGALAAVIGFVLALAASAQAAVPLTRVFTDPFTNTTSQHQTAVEPDTFAFGSTMVTATQSGRFNDGGSSGIGWATLDSSGAVLGSGTLPGITTHNGNGGTYDRVSDPSVAYDAAHAVWLISSIPITTSLAVPVVYVHRSTDGGLHWSGPVTVTTSTTNDLDKNWSVCDNHPASAFYGHCYTTWDDHGNGNRLLVSTSADGGLTWGPARATANSATGLGGQPVVKPDGTVIIPAANANETAIIAYRSTDGGASWGSTVSVASVRSHTEAGSLRSGPLPSAEISDDGTVYVSWADCRFRSACRANDIVYSTSTTGQTWTAVTRVPIDATNSGVDHFLPGLAVTGSGTTTKLGLTYYFYRQTACGSSCRLEVGYIQSNNAGAAWGAHVDVAGPFNVSLTPNTTQGRMVGDYISTSWIGGKAFGAFAVAQAPGAGFAFDQALYVPAGGLATSAAATTATASDHVFSNAASDHAAAQSHVHRR
ncbi:MAG: hypothetical protein QOF55_2047 [Thermoleophilaceae bacterium]|nr:hypothetical protein [Thermoleophilaceae bacterium]